MQLTLIRHLPTEWNETGHLQGKKDIPISQRVLADHRERIHENKNRLNHLAPFDIVFASTLSRTRQTALIYGYDHPSTEPLLNELDFGSFEGQRKTEVVKAFSTRWFKNPKSIRLGEHLRDFENRVIQFIHRYKDCERLLIFGHGSWIRALLSVKMNGDIQMMNRIDVANNTLVHVSVEAARIGGGEHEQYSYL